MGKGTVAECTAPKGLLQGGKGRCRKVGTSEMVAMGAEAKVTVATLAKAIVGHANLAKGTVPQDTLRMVSNAFLARGTVAQNARRQRSA